MKIFAAGALVLAMTMPAAADVRSDKAAFLKTVDESISGNRIANNPFKFVGKHVDLHCTVTIIPDRDWFNADCSTTDDVAIIVIEHDSSSLESGQSIRVLGIVQEPSEGTNLYGGATRFPDVLAKFME